MSKNNLLLVILLSLLFFIPLFVVRQLGPFDFWWWMSTNLVLMISLSFVFDKEYFNILKADFKNGQLKKILFGLISAAVLYGVFFLGNYLSRQWFGFAGSGIEGVYNFKGDADLKRIFLLMLLVIGPGEEIFWRGVLQRQFEERQGKVKGYILATILYTGVHVFSGNIMLIVAALVAGLFWGWMYMKYRSVLMNVVSHTAWDIAVFLLFPFV